jgi:hypothetical protein
MRRDDYSAALRAHGHATRCVREVQRCFRSIADEAMLVDIANNQSTQNSGGMSSGTSGGRSADYDYRQRQRRLLELSLGPQPSSAAERAAEVAALMPRAPVWDGTSIVHFTAAKRRHLEAEALRRAKIIPIGSRYSHAERQIELARLARGA